MPDIVPLRTFSFHNPSQIYYSKHCQCKHLFPFNTIFDDTTFTHLYPAFGQPAESPGRLVLITLTQNLEDLTHLQETASTAAITLSWLWLPKHDSANNLRKLHQHSTLI
jgi:hypothetical protein